jgi:hypothetical protein
MGIGTNNHGTSDDAKGSTKPQHIANGPICNGSVSTTPVNEGRCQEERLFSVIKQERRIDHE